MAFPIEAGVSVGVKDWVESALLVEVLRRDPELGVLRSSSVSHCQIKGGSVKDFRKAFWVYFRTVFMRASGPPKRLITKLLTLKMKLDLYEIYMGLKFGPLLIMSANFNPI